MTIYQLRLDRLNRMGHLGDLLYFTSEALAITAGEAAGVNYTVRPVWWG